MVGDSQVRDSSIMAEKDIAELIVTDRNKANFKRVSDKIEAHHQKLLDDGFNLPSPIPKLKDLTDSQLRAIMKASEFVLGLALILENEVKGDILKIDAEIMKRRP